MEAPSNQNMDREDKVVDQCCSCCYDCFQDLLDFLCCGSDCCY
ncbi:hypothetical protein BVRB_6g134500 [Beta vulgaris subsp. vulgaris]|nr:hypothetical protein BVRB_6g134500 [Beta vulgaris subsp. vulgaris]